MTLAAACPILTFLIFILLHIKYKFSENLREIVTIIKK
jgi:hypothetical protein